MLCKNSCVLPLSHLEDACGHLFFFQLLHSKPVIFFVYVLKETDGENHRGESQQNTASLGRDHPIHIGSQMARRGDLGVHLVRRGQSIAWGVPCAAWEDEELDAFPFLTVLSSPHCLGHFHANCVFSLLRAKCWTVPKILQSIQFCGLKGQFLFCLTKYTKTFLSQDHWNLNLQGTLKVWPRGTYIWGESPGRLHGR